MGGLFCGVWFFLFCFFPAQHFCIFSGEKGNRLGVSSCRVAHTLGRFELIYCSLRSFSLRIFFEFFGRSFAAGHHLPGRGDNRVGLMSVVLY